MIFENQIAINEEAIFSKDKKNPVYIVLSSGSSLFAKGIKAVTKSEFSHAMISFNSKLDPLYSFGTKAGGKGLGFVVNNPKDYVFDVEDAKYAVYVMFVTDKAKKAMKDSLQFFIDNKDKLKYDFHGIADIWIVKTSDQRQGKWFCSRFVMFLISKATELSKAPSLWRPGDIDKLDSISLVNRGFNFYNYNYKVTDRHVTDIKKGKYNAGDVLYETSDMSPTVYFIRDITPQSLLAIYHALNHPMRGKVGVKISTGEYGGHNYLKPELIKDLVEEVDGTIIECNTAYKGSRNTFKAHWDTIKKHGFTKIANVDLMDEKGDFAIPVRNGYHLSDNYLGKSASNYNSIIMLSHFKGHMMAGYGGALKNMSIGMASARGKNMIHTAGKGGDIMKTDRDYHNYFLESMVDADSSVMDYYDRDNIIYINVANNLSVDCDCDPHPHKPEIADIGIFASLDPVAVDQACIDAIYKLEDPKKRSLIQRIESRNGTHTIDCAEKKGLGSRKYNLIDISDISTLVGDNDVLKNMFGSITESGLDDYNKYITTGNETYLEEEYKRMYKPYYYKIPLVGFPTNNRTEYNEVTDAAKIAASSYYKFKVSDANREYPFKFFNVLDISKKDYMKLINQNVPMNKRYLANLYHVNIRDDEKRISIILVAIPGTIYSMYLLLPNNVLYKFNYEGLMYQESVQDEVKFYKNPAQQLQIKSSKKRNSKIRTGNYSDTQKPVPKPTIKKKRPVKEETQNIEKAADDARKLLTKEIIACKDCAYMYKDIMLPYNKDDSYAIIGWDMNKLKPHDDFDGCKNAVFGYCSKIYNQTHPEYCMDCDDNCFYIYKK